LGFGQDGLDAIAPTNFNFCTFWRSISSSLFSWFPSLPERFSDPGSAIKKKAMKNGSPWPNEKAMGFPPMAFEFYRFSESP